MPTVLTYKIEASIDKGSSIKSESKFETGPCIAVIDEVICRCTPSYTIDLDEDVANIEMLVISADPYRNEKECVPNGMNPPPCKYLKYQIFTLPAPTAATPAPSAIMKKDDDHKPDYPCIDNNFHILSTPHVISCPFVRISLGPNATRLQKLVFCNELSVDVKVSVMVVRRNPKLKCDPTNSAAASCCK
jgi:hypothetical protein